MSTNADSQQSTPASETLADDVRYEAERVLRWENEGTRKRLWIAMPLAHASLALCDESERLREALEDTREFISRARPLLGIAMGNSLGKQADDLYVEIGNALEGGNS